MTRVAALILLILLLTTGCAATDASPDVRPTQAVRATQSEYFRSAMGMFLFEVNKPGVVRYAFAVNVLKPLPPGAKAIVEFENPADPSAPFIAEAKDINGNLHFGTPDVVLEPGRAYYARLRLIDSNNQTISTHLQWIYFPRLPGKPA